MMIPNVEDMKTFSKTILKQETMVDLGNTKCFSRGLSGRGLFNLIVKLLLGQIKNSTIKLFSNSLKGYAFK